MARVACLTAKESSRNHMHQNIRKLCKSRLRGFRLYSGMLMPVHRNIINHTDKKGVLEPRCNCIYVSCFQNFIARLGLGLEALQFGSGLDQSAPLKRLHNA